MLHPTVLCRDDEEDVGEALDLVEESHQAGQCHRAVGLEAGQEEREEEIIEIQDQ